jgi:uncharacterized RDD family membrane protein YckC
MTESSTVSPVPREARPYQGHRAGVVTRVVAAVIDGVVVALVVGAGYAGLAAFLFALNPRNFQFGEVSWVASLAVAFCVLVVYLTASWSLGGRSYGAVIMGVRVVRSGGQTLGLVGAFVRAVACAVFPIGLLWCAVSRRSRSLQDILLRTKVVYDWTPRRPSGHLTAAGDPSPTAGDASPTASDASPTASDARPGR